MRRLLVLSLFLTMVAGAFAPAATAAQDTGTAIGPAVGETSPIFSEDGNEMGSITVNNIIEPFEAYDAGYEPLRGYHYVIVEVTIANAGSRPMTGRSQRFAGHRFRWVRGGHRVCRRFSNRCAHLSRISRCAASRRFSCGCDCL